MPQRLCRSFLAWSALAAALSSGACPAQAAPAPSDTSPISAAVSVDWKARVGTTTAATFSANDEMCSSPAKGSGDAAYARNMADIGIKFFRLHCGSLTDDWSSAAAHQWNIDAIKAEYSAPYLRGATIIQNIPSPPSWLRRKDQTVSDAPAYAAYCARLVAIVNTRLKKHVVYWEPMNEWEDRYKGRWPEACAVYNLCALAMKKQDPTIKVGPALEWPNQGGVIQPLLQKCGPNVDFIAYHSYYSSGPFESNDALMAKASLMEHDVSNTQDSIKKHAPGRTIPIMLDEFNLDGNWNDPETRQHTNFGAVYFATTIKHDAYAGIYGCSIWSAKEGTYGITDMDDRLRTPAYLLKWANHNLIGALVRTASTHPMVEAMAVLQGGTPAVMVINKASGPATINLHLNRAGTMTYCTLTADGMSAPQTVPPSGLSAFVMPPCSLLFVSCHAAGRLKAVTQGRAPSEPALKGRSINREKPLRG